MKISIFVLFNYFERFIKLFRFKSNKNVHSLTIFNEVFNVKMKIISSVWKSFISFWKQKKLYKENSKSFDFKIFSFFRSIAWTVVTALLSNRSIFGFIRGWRKKIYSLNTFKLKLKSRCSWQKIEFSYYFFLIQIFCSFLCNNCFAYFYYFKQFFVVSN